MKYLVVDDHQLIFHGLRLVLNEIDSNIELLHAMTGAQALDILSDARNIDLILLDMNLPDIQGTQLLEMMAEQGITIPAVIISSSLNPIEAHNAIEKGARGFIPKSMNGQEMILALQTIRMGQIYLPPDWRELIACVINSNYDKKLRLTPRQMDVLQLMSFGHSNKEIANKLNLTEHTVKIHVRSLLQIFNAHNRTACIHEAQRRGMLG